MFQKIISEQLNLHLKRYNVLPAKQSGFRVGCGCASALVDMVDDAIGALDKVDFSVLLSLDFSISHKLLLSILHFFSLEINAIKVFS